MAAPLRDPEEFETRHLQEMAEVRGARVLEVGTGDGRMTWRYAELASLVAAFDPDRDRLAEALRDRPADLADTALFFQGTSDRLPFTKEAFQTVVLAWSL